MEVIREAGPLLLGALALSPLLSRLLQRRSADLRTIVTVLACLLIGFVWSLLVGEQTGPDLFDRLFPIVIDTCLAYTGCSVAHWLLWSRLLRPAVA